MPNIDLLLDNITQVVKSDKSKSDIILHTRFKIRILTNPVGLSNKRAM